MRRLLDQVDLASDQHVHLLLGVGHLDDLDAVDLDDLAAAGQPDGGSPRGLYFGFFKM